MQHSYPAWLSASLLACLPLLGAAQTAEKAATPNSTDAVACAVIGQVAINGPDVLTGTNMYYLTPSPGQGTFQDGNVSWSVSPASAFAIYGSTTGNTLLLGPAAGCGSATGTISVTLPVSYCGDIRLTTFQKTVTVTSGGGAPVVRGTYYCTTCADQSVKPLQLDGNTNNVTRYGTYRIDLTSSSSQDTFLAWDKFETAGATLRMVPGTNNHSGLIDLSPNASLAALAGNVTNGCSSTRQTFRFSGQLATGYLVAGPNPTTNELILEEQMPPSASADQAATAPYSAVLYNGQGLPVRSIPAGHGKVKMDVRALPAGIYTLRTTTQAATKSEQIVIAR